MELTEKEKFLLVHGVDLIKYIWFRDERYRVKISREERNADNLPKR